VRQRGSIVRLWLLGIDGGHRPERKADGKRASATFVALNRDRAVVRGHDGPGDGQPQPGALDLLLPGDRGAVEALEDPLLVGRGDADTSVGDSEHYLIPFHPEPDLDPPSVRGELDGIGQKVGE
jgi:hypothetical protein